MARRCQTLPNARPSTIRRRCAFGIMIAEPRLGAGEMYCEWAALASPPRIGLTAVRGGGAAATRRAEGQVRSWLVPNRRQAGDHGAGTGRLLGFLCSAPAKAADFRLIAAAEQAGRNETERGDIRSHGYRSWKRRIAACSPPRSRSAAPATAGPQLDGLSSIEINSGDNRLAVTCCGERASSPQGSCA